MGVFIASPPKKRDFSAILQQAKHTIFVTIWAKKHKIQILQLWVHPEAEQERCLELQTPSWAMKHHQDMQNFLSWQAPAQNWPRTADIWNKIWLTVPEQVKCIRWWRESRVMNGLDSIFHTCQGFLARNFDLYMPCSRNPTERRKFPLLQLEIKVVIKKPKANFSTKTEQLILQILLDTQTYKYKLI